jgi:DNA-directed RNA polymerase subunit N (RpoN/RPB10)
MILDVESLDNFIEETYQEYKSRIMKTETMEKDEKGMPQISFLVIYTYAHVGKGIIIRFIEDCGKANAEDQKEIEKRIEERNKRITAAITKFKENDRPFGLGVWRP